MYRRCIVLLLLWLTVSCDNRLDLYGTVSFNVEDAPCVRSHSGSMVPESMVKNISYFLFDADNGNLVRSVTTVSRSVEMSGVPYGSLTVYAVANVDVESFRNIVSLEEFKETVILHYLSAFKEYIPMKTTVDFVLDTSVKSVSLSLERVMSRLRLVRVHNRLVGLSEGEDIRLKRAYLTNIQGGFYVDMKANTTIWYSKFGRLDFLPSETSYITSANDVITGFHSFRDIADVSVMPGMDVSLGELESFYVFPNHTLYDETGWQSGGFTERYTRMVLVAEIKGTEYYYPVNLLNMVSNHSYDVVYTISRLGSDDPDTFTSVEMQENEIDFEEIEDGGEIEIKF